MELQNRLGLLRSGDPGHWQSPQEAQASRRRHGTPHWHTPSLHFFFAAFNLFFYHPTLCVNFKSQLEVRTLMPKSREPWGC